MSFRTLLNKLLKHSSYQVTKTNQALNLYSEKIISINIEYFLAKILVEEKNNFFFIQIGANDGVRADDTYDFIIRHRLRGIVIEPLHDMFIKLCENYVNHPQIIKINKAIHATEKQMTLYRIRKDAPVPDWCHGIASFDKNHFIGGMKKIPDLDKYIIEETVECISLSRLLKEKKIQQLSFLQIDTEGYDFEIIKMIDFNKNRPKIIRYECACLSPADNLSCIKMLAKYGYVFYDDGNDIIALASD